MENPCIRCGKERIKGSERVVILNATKTKITTHICPDSECQNKVEKQIADKEERKLFLSTRNRNRVGNKSAN